MRSKEILRRMRLDTSILLWSSFGEELLDIKLERIPHPPENSTHATACIFMIENILQTFKEGSLTIQEMKLFKKTSSFWLNLPGMLVVWIRVCNWLPKEDQDIIEILMAKK